MLKCTICFVLQIPKTQAEWLTVATDFETIWNFPHCVGAIDGKHVTLKCPIASGSEYINYKGFFSIVLLALVDANYNFMFVDVGCQGRISDGGVIANTQLYKLMEEKALNLPEPAPLNEREEVVPFFFVGDEAFSMSETLMKAYPGYHVKGSKQRIFNYRICRARRVVENVFGIASSVFRVLRKPLLLEPEKASCVVMTTTLLHNFLRRRPDSAELYTPPGTFDSEEAGVVRNGNWREATHEMGSLLPLKRVARKTKATLLNVREEIADYFLNEGKLAWQNDYA
ncbi:putative nuclease HARBI1 [Portunus trituberculatus]|uniref:putative nuclease HARBI1 n=1 Tax=Portunus trituberculatus TaxID=210409 RepID=UPI001E1CCF1A|nr:putative nuclease HARBI1 [Portunus trituberculatus]XP_045109840.1 putative nuclease HARBI1 [Portunus trituberculatus]